MSPYISIVVASRNDNHGGDMHRRMRLFVNGLKHQCQKHGIPMELVFVEWNPPADMPLLHEVLPNSGGCEYLTIRYIQVPAELHQQYRYAEAVPLFQMTAKNVGIRRAKGKFVLCTNVDILFSDPIFEAFAKRQLRENCFYRCNRLDVPANINEKDGFERQLQFCENNLVARLGNKRYFNIMDKYLWNVFRNMGERGSAHLLHMLETNACGDFTMMTPKAWNDIKGYAELDLYSIHIDSLGIVAAAAIGYRQVVFPKNACVYHIYHKSGWESMKASEKIKFWEKRPGIGWDVVYNAALEALTERKIFDVNPPELGFCK